MRALPGKLVETRMGSATYSSIKLNKYAGYQEDWTTRWYTIAGLAVIVAVHENIVFRATMGGYGMHARIAYVLTPFGMGWQNELLLDEPRE